MSNFREKKLAKQTMFDQIGPKFRKTDHVRPVWAKNDQNGQLGRPKRSMIDESGSKSS